MNKKFEVAYLFAFLAGILFYLSGYWIILAVFFLVGCSFFTLKFEKKKFAFAIFFEGVVLGVGFFLGKLLL